MTRIAGPYFRACLRGDKALDAGSAAAPTSGRVGPVAENGDKMFVMEVRVSRRGNVRRASYGAGDEVSTSSRMFVRIVAAGDATRSTEKLPGFVMVLFLAASSLPTAGPRHNTAGPRGLDFITRYPSGTCVASSLARRDAPGEAEVIPCPTVPLEDETLVRRVWSLEPDM